MQLPDTIKQWNKCVKHAKKKHESKATWGFIPGRVLKDAQKCYCAMSFLGAK
jgi:hypothetical protein